MDPTAPDEVIRFVRKIKEETAARHGFDVRAIAASARARQGNRGHRVIIRSETADPTALATDEGEGEVTKKLRAKK